MALIHWWPLNGDLMDRVGNNHLSIYEKNNNGVIKINKSGKIGACYERVQIDTPDLLRSEQKIKELTEISMCAWIYISEIANYNSANGIISCHNHANKSGLGIGVYCQSSNADQYYVSINMGNGSDRVWADGKYRGTTNLKGAWHHVCLTYGGDKKIRIYVDGVEDMDAKNYDLYMPSDYLDVFNWSTGYINSTSYRPACKVNDIRIYDHALSKAEIMDLSKGLLIHYNFSDYCSQNLCNWRNLSIIKSAGHGERKNYENGVLELTAVNGWRAFMWDIGEENIGKPLTFSFEYKVKNEIQANQIWIQNADTVYYTPSVKKLNINQIEWKKETYITEEAQQYIGINLRQRDQTGEETTLYLRNVKIALNNFDDTYSEYSEEARITDSSGYEHNGVVYNGEPSSDSIRGSKSCRTPRIIPTKVNASINPENSSYIETQVFKESFTPDEFTISIWWKPVNWGSGIGPLGLVSTKGNYQQSTFSVYDGTTKVNFTNGEKRLYTVTKCPLGQWSHFVVAYKPGEVSYYLNGTKTFSEIDPSATLQPWRFIHLGAECAGGVLRDGDIYWGDFRYYTTCLSEYDILGLFEAKGYITNRNNLECWEFVEGKDVAECLNSAIFEAAEFLENPSADEHVLIYQGGQCSVNEIIEI